MNVKTAVTLLAVLLATGWACGQQAPDTEDTPAPSQQEEIGDLLQEAAALDRVGDSEGALKCYDQVLALDATHTYARFSKGTVLVKMERFAEALKILEPMLAEQPKDYFLKNNVAWIYAAAPDHNIRNGRKAIALAQDALLLAPTDHHVWNTLSEAYFVCGEYDKAVETSMNAFYMARDARVTQDVLKEFQQQVIKCQRAAQAMQLLE